MNGPGPSKKRKNPDQDVNDESIYNPSDAYVAEKTRIALDSTDESGSESDYGQNGDEAVLGIDGSSQGEEDEEDSDDSEDDMLSQLPPHLQAAARRAAAGASSSDSEEDEEGAGKKRGAAAAATLKWGKSRKAYYDADTADLEIGQEFEEAEEEELAALEQQRASYHGMTAADFGDEASSSESEDDGDNENDNDTIGSKLRHGGSANSAVASSVALQNLLVGGSKKGVAGVERVAKRNLEGLSKKEKLQLVINDSPELPSLLAELRRCLDELQNRIDPLAKEVTADLGASDDGLIYLQSKRQLLLAIAQNTCFYMLLKAKGYKGAKDHPVVGRILQLRQLAQALEPIDKQLEPQVDLLVEALSEGIDLRAGGAGEENEENENNGSSNDSDQENSGLANDLGSDSDYESFDFPDDDQLDEEEAQFAADVLDDGSQDEKPKKSSKSAKKLSKKGKVLANSAAAEHYEDFGDDETEAIKAKERAGKAIAAMNQKARTGAESDIDSEEDDFDGSGGLLDGIPEAALAYFAGNSEKSTNKNEKESEKKRRSAPPADDGQGSDDEFLTKVVAAKERKKAAKSAKYTVVREAPGALGAELEEWREKKYGGKRGASQAMIKNRGLTPHKSKINRNPRVKKREAFRKAVIRRKGQVQDVRVDEVGRYGGEATGIRSTITRSRRLG